MLVAIVITVLFIKLNFCSLVFHHLPTPSADPTPPVSLSAGESVSRLFSGTSPVSLTTVGIIILVLLVLDVIFTLGFAAFAASVAGRSARQDYDIPFLGAAANHLYSRSAHTNEHSGGGGSANCTAVVEAPTVRRWSAWIPLLFPNSPTPC